MKGVLHGETAAREGQRQNIRPAKSRGREQERERRMRRTKIVCTIGPASNSEEMLKKLVRSGMNVARLNFSHGTHAYHKETMDRVKRVREEMNVPLAILLDTRGPEIRVKDFAQGAAQLEEGARFVLTTREIAGTAQEVTNGLPTSQSKFRRKGRPMNGWSL